MSYRLVKHKNGKYSVQCLMGTGRYLSDGPYNGHLWVVIGGYVDNLKMAEESLNKLRQEEKELIKKLKQEELDKSGYDIEGIIDGDE